jgi:four helix bundle protein
VDDHDHDYDHDYDWDRGLRKETGGKRMTFIFDHEKLRVYQDAIAFVSWCEDIFQRASRKAAAYDQLDRASTSIALNIAEGNGKFSNKDRCRFFDISRSSALECAACLDILVAKGHLERRETESGRKKLHGIVSMLMGLIQTFSDRVSEDPETYGSPGNE